VDMKAVNGAEPTDWDAICASAPRYRTFTCRRCAKTWTPRVGASGWNRCPSCKTIYSRASLLRPAVTPGAKP
jgi:hypothetical protein